MKKRNENIGLALIKQETNVSFMLRSPFAADKIESAIGNNTLMYPKCAAHINKNSIDQKSGKMITLQNTVFLLQAYFDKKISAIKRKNEVFMKCMLNKHAFSCAAKADGKNVIISYEGSIPNSAIDMCIPLALLAVITDPECYDRFIDCINNQTVESVYCFCDTVYYNFIDIHIPNYTVDDELSVAEIKQAYKTGMYDKIDEFEVPFQEKKRPAANIEPKNEVVPENKIDEYLNGKHIIQHQWSGEQKKRIVPLSFLNGFVPIPEFYRLMKKMDVRIGKNMVANDEFGFTSPEDLRKDAVNLLLYGNPGTGKTVLAHALSAATGMPLYEVKFDKYTESDEIEGKNKIINGQLAFTQTDFLEGYENGGIILMEEINCADQNVITGSLNNAIEYPFFITKNGYEKVTRNPFTVIIATMNVGTEGTMWLNQAFASRFKQKYRISDPTTEDFIRFLTNYGYSKSAAVYVHTAYTKVMALLQANRATAEYAMNLSTRACLGALENMSEGEDAKIALMDTIVGSIGIVDPKTAENICKNIIENLPAFKGKV